MKLNDRVSPLARREPRRPVYARAPPTALVAFNTRHPALGAEISALGCRLPAGSGNEAFQWFAAILIQLRTHSAPPSLPPRVAGYKLAGLDLGRTDRQAPAGAAAGLERQVRCNFGPPSSRTANCLGLSESDLN
jgi:hypothetical protein